MTDPNIFRKKKREKMIYLFYQTNNFKRIYKVLFFAPKYKRWDIQKNISNYLNVHFLCKLKHDVSYHFRNILKKIKKKTRKRFFFFH